MIRYLMAVSVVAVVTAITKEHRIIIPSTLAHLII